ncbi:MAG TPA: hypothetical protein GXZ28_00040 [Clostridiales bacterium]|nr:hypothetical protein [Clostridiales bacterium]
MKKKVIFILLIFIIQILFLACDNVSDETKVDMNDNSKIETGNDELSYNEYPEYFRQALLTYDEIKNSDDNQFSFFSETEGFFSSKIILDDNKKYLFKIDEIPFKNGKMIKDLELDLDSYIRNYMEKNQIGEEIENIQVFLDSAFLDDNGDIVYLYFDSINSDQCKEFYGLLVEFPFNNPSEYQITELNVPYENDQEPAPWFINAIRFGDYIYQTCYKSLLVIDIKTKEAKFEDKIYQEIYEYVSDFHEYGKGCYYDLKVIADFEDTLVYQWQISEANDTPILYSCYFAYQKDKLIDILVVNEETGEIRTEKL